MTDHIRFTALHPKRILASCFVVSPSIGLSCSISPQIFSACFHNNELLFSCPVQNFRTEENFILSSGTPELNADKIPVVPRAEATHNFLAEQSGGNLRGLFDFDSAQPERIKTKSIGVRMVSTQRKLRLCRQTSNPFSMGVIPFREHSGLATSVYEKGCAPANFPQESACSPA